jgi:hypothetical protein
MEARSESRQVFVSRLVGEGGIRNGKRKRLQYIVSES